MLAIHQICPSNSPWSSPVVLVHKKEVWQSSTAEEPPSGGRSCGKVGCPAGPQLHSLEVSLPASLHDQGSDLSAPDKGNCSSVR